MSECSSDAHSTIFVSDPGRHSRCRLPQRPGQRAVLALCLLGTLLVPPPRQAARFPSANPFLCLLSSLQLSVEDLRAYAASTIVGPRTAVVGTGIDHETLVKLASSTLGALPSANKAAAAPSKYFGGAEVSGCWRGRRLAWAATNLASRFLTLDFSPFPIPDSPQHGWPEQDARGPGL